jgi:phosphatidylglycerophosphate synthase
MNLPNAITMSRIAATPIIAALVINSAWVPRLSAWVLFIVAATTDYVDGKLARDRNLVKLLDPLADKLLLFATLLPMYWLMRDFLFTSLPPADAWAAGETVGAVVAAPGERRLLYPFVTPLGLVGLPIWILGVVLLREVMMTVFRQYAARKGIVIAALGPGKLKTTFQMIWVGAAFFWFMASSVAMEHGWRGQAWNAFALFNGIVGTVSMVLAIVLTVYSMALYVRQYGPMLRQG